MASYVTVSMETQTAADLAAIVRACRKHEDDGTPLDSRLRDAHMALESALRSVGWKPNPEGGWIQEVRRARR